MSRRKLSLTILALMILAAGGGVLYQRGRGGPGRPPVNFTNSGNNSAEDADSSPAPAENFLWPVTFEVLTVDDQSIQLKAVDNPDAEPKTFMLNSQLQVFRGERPQARKAAPSDLQSGQQVKVATPLPGSGVKIYILDKPTPTG